MSATLELLRAAQEGDRDACEQAVIENNGLIWSVVRRYYGRGVDPEDLYQLGCLGFLKAVQGFDFDYGTCFSTYAVPKIAGEIRRFLRDDGAVKVGRTMREQAQTLYTIRERLRQEFSANVSHELKTPLTSILGTAEILQNGLVKPEDVPHFAGNIHRETERLIGLVNDIIKLSRLDEGGGLGQWETVDLYEEARAVLEQLAPAAQRKQVTTRLQGGEALVRGVPQIVEEIVYNLCDNAIAYNRANGSVTVTVENTAFGPRITVADTGIGIPREAQGRVFERFYRVDKSHSSGGTGLGLSIVKHGAAYLGAQVELHSEPGHGSTFTLTFPKAGA